jgi:hypothetical protein
MKDKKKICGEIARRYQQADKKGRGKLLDEYTATLGYNRDYLAHILSNWGKTLYARVDGKPVTIIAQPAVKRGGYGIFSYFFAIFSMIFMVWGVSGAVLSGFLALMGGFFPSLPVLNL